MKSSFSSTDGLSPLSYSLLFVAIFSATLWDFRFEVYRPFDLVSLISIVLFSALNTKIADFKHIKSKEIMLCGIIILWSIYGFIELQHRSSLAIIVGVFIFLLTRCTLKQTSIPLKNIFLIILSIHIFFFFLQLALFYGLNITFNPFYFLGYENRVINELALNPVLRPSGLFAEPNSYCVLVLSILATLLNEKNMKLVCFLAILTICFSQSLWGVVIAALLIILWAVSYYKTPRSCLISSFLMISVLYSAFFLSLYITEATTRDTPHFIMRLKSLESDPSLRERFQKNTIPKVKASNEDLEIKVPEKSNVKATTLGNDFLLSLFGSGLSTKYFFNGLPLNGFSLLYASFGIMGLILIAYTGLKLLYITPKKSLIQRYNWCIIFALMLTSYPLFTYIYFWLWLSLTMPLLNERTASNWFSLHKKN